MCKSNVNTLCQLETNEHKIEDDLMVQFSRLVISDFLQPHEPQHTRPPCPSPTPRVYSNLCPSRQWCYQTTSSSVIPISSHLQSCPASGSSLTSCLFVSCGQNTRASASASVLPTNIQGWFPLGFVGLIFLLSKQLSIIFSSTTIQKHQFFSTQPSLWSNSHICTWQLEKQLSWLDVHLSANWCLCFLIPCLGLLRFSFQGTSVF